MLLRKAADGENASLLDFNQVDDLFVLLDFDRHGQYDLVVFRIQRCGGIGKLYVGGRVQF